MMLFKMKHKLQENIVFVVQFRRGTKMLNATSSKEETGRNLDPLTYWDGQPALEKCFLLDKRTGDICLKRIPCSCNVHNLGMRVP